MADKRPTVGWASEMPLWANQCDSGKIEIVARAAKLAPKEGEHEIAFKFEEQTVYTLTFIFVEGGVLGFNSPNLTAIGGVQGAYLIPEKTRAASKLNGEIGPAAMLLLAAQALAAALGVCDLVGIGSYHHAARSYAAQSMALDYDRLWLEFGGLEDPNGWFHVNPRAEHKPLAQVNRTHRARARRRRELKARLYDEMFLTAQRILICSHLFPGIAQGDFQRSHVKAPSLTKLVKRKAPGREPLPFRGSKLHADHAPPGQHCRLTHKP